MAKIDSLFHLLHANHGSDLHLSAGNPPLLRIYGDLVRVDAPAVTAGELLAVLREMVPIERVRAFERTGDLDFAYEIPGLARYRANFFRQNRGISAVFREIPQRIGTVEELGLPIINWDVDTLDWKTKTDPQSVKQNILDQVEDGSIVLMHDLYSGTIEGVLAAIDELQSRTDKTYAFVTVSELAAVKGVSLEPGQVYTNIK